MKPRVPEARPAALGSVRRAPGVAHDDRRQPGALNAPARCRPATEFAPRGRGTASVPGVNPLRRYGRLLWLARRAPKLPELGLYDVCRSPRRVLLGDLDELRHMNNGVYLTLLDHARQELVVRTGLWARLRAAGMYPVVSAQSIAYRRSLRLGQRYVIESRMLGLDDRAVYIEQRFVVGDEIYARAYIQGRFLYEAGGTVPMEALVAVTGVDPVAHPIPAWLHDWAAANRLPSTRQPARSEW